LELFNTFFAWLSSMLGGKQVWKSPMSSLPCCLLLPHQKPHSFCRKLLNFGVVGTRDGDFDNFFVLFQESTKCLRSGEFGGEAGWYWSGGAGAWSECLYQCQLPLQQVNCVYLTHKISSKAIFCRRFLLWTIPTSGTCVFTSCWVGGTYNSLHRV
jgi:hypothetical protein